MRRLAIALACLACSGLGRRAQVSSRQEPGRPFAAGQESLKSIARFLLAHSPAAAFNSLGAQSSGSFGRSASSRSAARGRHRHPLMAEDTAELEAQLATLLKLQKQLAEMQSQVSTAAPAAAPAMPAAPPVTPAMPAAPPVAPAVPVAPPVEPDVSNMPQLDEAPAVSEALKALKALQDARMAEASGAVAKAVEKADDAAAVVDGNTNYVGILVAIAVGVPALYFGGGRVIDFFKGLFEDMKREQLLEKPKFNEPSGGNMYARQLVNQMKVEREIRLANQWDSPDIQRNAREIFLTGLKNLQKDPYGWFYGTDSALYSDAPPPLPVAKDVKKVVPPTRTPKGDFYKAAGQKPESTPAENGEKVLTFEELSNDEDEPVVINPKWQTITGEKLAEDAEQGVSKREQRKLARKGRLMRTRVEPRTKEEKAAAARGEFNFYPPPKEESEKEQRAKRK